MPIFYFHPQNAIAKKLQEQNEGERSFTYVNRAQLELRIQRLLADAGYDIDFRFHTIMGSMGNKLEQVIELNPDNETDRLALKLLKSTSHAPWSYVKVNNGPDLRQVVGYCSESAQNPFSMGPAAMAQKGIINSTVIPVAGG